MLLSPIIEKAVRPGLVRRRAEVYVGGVFSRSLGILKLEIIQEMNGCIVDGG